MNRFRPIKYLLLFQFPLCVSTAMAQPASIKQTGESIKTYPFSDPNPIPALGINKKVAPFYPYFMFDGYTDKGTERDWKIVKLENPFITVSVLPEVGGKVMGAVEKATGEEFVYTNHVMKFRAIGIRGPWTSGGIEHNFGLDLGHAPWAGAAVDYVIKNNDDGSVSCIVGGLDLASRSEWRVNIRLPKDKAYFETESLWYNPTPLHHAYLSWENAAFKATNDLQFYFPGNHHIGHDGSAAPWPFDKEGRNLAMYKDNNFGGSKSYHVVGNYRNWFGGYWHDKKFGFGHWAPYSDAPGKKLWIWSLSREGAIWENLLTDNDGQYIEAQSGVMLNQAAERSGYHSPFTQLSLRPLYAETKREYWFPVKNTGGMADATPYGTLNVEAKGDSLKISISPNATVADSLVVKYNNNIVYSAYLQLQPMQVYNKSLLLPQLNVNKVRVSLGNDKLLFADKKESNINRPVVASTNDQVFTSAQRLFRMAEEQNSMRNYIEALHLYEQCLLSDPLHNEALNRIAEYYYRSGEFEKGIGYARKVLEQNSYDGGANFIYGNLLLKQGKLTEAEEAFSIAARIMEYRSAALVHIAGIEIQKGSFDVAADYAKQSIQYNSNNLLAYQRLATAYRRQQDVAKADSVLNVLLNIDPLSHYARFEQYLLKPSATTLAEFNNGIKNELPHETYLELALTYVANGLNDEAIKVLEQAPAYPTVFYWLAYLKRNNAPQESAAHLKKAEALSPAFVFPFRLETIPVLTWAQQQRPSWKTTYYLALVYWNNLQSNKAKELFEQCGNVPDFAPFYLVRGALFQGDSSKNGYVGKNFERAIQLQPAEWRTWHSQSNYLYNNGSFAQNLDITRQACKRFTTNPVIAMDHAKALLNTNRFAECLSVLEKVLILPQEGASEGHQLYELANLSLALQMAEQKKYQQAIRYLNDSKKWPENLGSGSPYDPDERLQHFLLAYCKKQLGKQKEAAADESQLLAVSTNAETWSQPQSVLYNYFSLLALNNSGKRDELNNVITQWKTEQDSLKNWNLSAGSSAPEFRWVMAKFNNDNEAAAMLQKQFLADPTINRIKLFFTALQLAGVQK